MGNLRLLQALESNIEKYGKEMGVYDYDQVLALLETTGQITTAEHQSLLLKLAMTKLGKETSAGNEVLPLRP